MSEKVNIAGSSCAAGISSIHAVVARQLSEVTASRRCCPEGLSADSESQILAIKKFSCLTASHLILARQSGFFLRIAKTDSQQGRGDGLPIARPSVRAIDDRQLPAHAITPPAATT
jgi:hypothetical protein